MKKSSILIGIIALLIALPVTAMAGSTKCATKYPVVLSHGMAAKARIAGILDYWGTIPKALRDNGADVYLTSVNGMDSTANKAAQWKAQVRQILAVSGKKKINLIGHSHGTIYSRYAITNLGMASKVASHTSICGPHRGSPITDMIMADNIPSALRNSLLSVLDLAYTFVMGDVDGSTLANVADLTRDNMINVFNPNTPNISSIYYQSYAFKITNFLGGGLLLPTWKLMIPYESDNDGLVAVSSAKWGNFREVITGIPMFGGVNHLAAVDLLSLPTPGYDAQSFFKCVVADLKKRGY